MGSAHCMARHLVAPVRACWLRRRSPAPKVSRTVLSSRSGSHAAGLLDGADGGEQALHRVQRPVGVVGRERIAVRPPVAGFAQLAGEALPGPRELMVER